ncbi:ferritin-like domain-containing protein [Leptolyngbya sp. FACHB-711]|uniref:ferritin-like domain-containing protein n=1 Tax=unclassified Leptolyngbya TaxID=2650499 RepID=UPI001688EDB8|nr:ferritin-like domain-containing protein [Leptolyngbya sp. FACHB-711]MBD1852899.1 ferritin-like domain-containing protein [Cyanobacteria bacterium FACHB-502]MBD2023405.1 ferritin-like domain-containing protein [Leptolyngbya sp. FACHB-711]
MNLLTQVLHLVGSGAVAYITAANIRDPKSRPNLLAGFQLAESGSVPFLEALSKRAAAEGDEWLSERLAKHAQDEGRHGQIFAHALKQLNKQVIDFKSLPQKPDDGKPDERRRSPFFEAYYEGYDVKTMFAPDRIDWLLFMGSTYILELDACKDFVRMANALPDDPISLNLKKGMISIAKDEEGHAAYLREAMQRRLGYAKAEALITEWRTRKVNAMIAMATNLLQKGGQLPSMARDGVPSELAENPTEFNSAGESTTQPVAA